MSSLREDLKAYLDGELPPARMDEIRAALERDPALEKEYLELRSISEGLALFAAQPEAKGLESTLRALDRSKKRTWLDSGLLWVPVSVAAAFLFAAILFPVFSQAKLAAKKSMRMNRVALSSAGEDKSDSLADNAPMSAAKAPSMDALKKAVPQRLRERVARRPSTWVNTPSSTAEGGIIAGAVSGTVVTTSSGKQKPKPPQTVVLAFDSPEIGEKRVIDLVGPYRVEEASLKAPTDPTLGPIKEEPTTIVVEVPETEADSTIVQLKQLPNRPLASFRSREAGSFGGGFGGGGGGGRSAPGGVGGARGGAGGPGGPTGTPPAAGATTNGVGGFGAPPSGRAARTAAPLSKSAKNDQVKSSSASTQDMNTLSARGKSPAMKQEAPRPAPPKMRRIVIQIIKKKP